MNTNQQKKKSGNVRGFTIVELMVSIFVFLLIMLAIVQIFTQQINAYRHARSVQNDLENAQFAMNYLSKTFRTAAVLGSTTDGDLRQYMQDNYSNDDFATSTLQMGEGLFVYDYSQELCMKFTFRPENHKNGYPEKALWVVSKEGVNFDEIENPRGGCIDNTIYDTAKEQRLTTGSVTGVFIVAPTRYQNILNSKQTDTMGKVTVGMSVLPGKQHLKRGDSPEPVYLQSTVSLRDYPPDLSF